MQVSIWAEPDTQDHWVYVIFALGYAIGFYDILDFCEELHYLHDHGKWMP